MGRNRKRSERNTLKRRALERVTETVGTDLPATTDTTDQHEGESRIADSSPIRSEHVEAIQSIVMFGERDSDRVAAFKALLSYAKEMETKERSSSGPTHVHGHVHLESHDGGTGVFEIAKSLGLSLSLGEDEGADCITIDPRKGPEEVGQGPDQ